MSAFDPRLPWRAHRVSLNGSKPERAAILDSTGAEVLQFAGQQAHACAELMVAATNGAAQHLALARALKEMQEKYDRRSMSKPSDESLRLIADDLDTLVVRHILTTSLKI